MIDFNGFTIKLIEQEDKYIAQICEVQDVIVYQICRNYHELT